MSTKTVSENFLKASLPWETLEDGLKRQFLGFDDKIMMVKVTFKKGGVGQLHEHYHSQTTYVVSGKFDVTIDGETQTLEGGDAFYVPPHAVHGAVCLEDGMLIDVFSPAREDFLKD
ncbi:cupin domain-containing protein [Sediminitomix flava]|uniref:Cupin domain-containing protein n=1 Tax=Sediminitomix flava TaxID=379075 RepID=A0A315ZIV8_SEDFL|nr:cupin domain-containing protein [Sediminitomix flava]PWJ44758.1 Cupin domain-containing protein [Sediminitomix flava]